MPESPPQNPLTAHGLPRCDRRRGFWQAWLHLRAAEHGGLLYERLGLRPIFGAIAGTFGETLPPAASRTQSAEGVPDLDEARRIYWWSRYHEVVNTVAFALQTPLAPLGASGGSAPLAVLGGAICAMHAFCVGLERYRRARSLALLAALPDGGNLADARPGARYSPPPPLLLGPVAEAWFRPRWFEGDRFYRATGAWTFRRVVLWVYSVAFEGSAAAGRGPDFLPRGRAGLLALEGQSRVAELSHLFGMALHLPFLLLALRSGMPVGAAYVGFLLCLNAWCALIQRSHRSRMAGALARLRARA